ncbi:MULTISPECIES: FAD-binding protein [unclassified Saccharopolyspora]|uniref:FAD-binding protein n=1 Tax=unclassified Saccharopolyspora TaxID=2646250 RepID=UPI001CD43AC8|nr:MULTISPECIES: FAD-binding protein [unclassified Saccharopolyspora]MCA1189575.1 FAD-binding protein [Saccharopolyspora sp. 6T]MCA1281716.1 FAD-binding protein [Saccharopolyspora sp. 7B]
MQNLFHSEGAVGEEIEADVVVVGFGVAGACAALEAAEAGAEVVVLDRFGGGGTSRLSGGIVYAGGGTRPQRAAGVTDSVEDVYAYLRAEVGDAVSPATLRRFCAGGPEMIDWLEARGVRFGDALAPYKTSYPSRRHHLYYSGSEAAGGFRDLARPAPRGHRPVGRGTSGKVLHTALARAVRAAGVRILDQTRVTGLIRDGGEVHGVECATLRTAARPARALHRTAARLAAKPGIYLPVLARRLHAVAERVERRRAVPLRIRARRGVVLAAGGFIADRELLRHHAPRHRGGLPLGTRADDGSGIRLGRSAGGTTDKLGNVSVWRFITPPSEFLHGVLVDEHGKRVCDESRYGAALGDALVHHHGGRGWLLIDAETRRRALRSLPRQTVWFQLLQALHLLHRRAVTAPTITEVAELAGIDPAGLAATAHAHDTAAPGADPVGKPAEFVRPLRTPPYTLLDLSIRPSAAYPCPMLTLGGLRVDEDTGAVLDERDRPVPGLHAAGRTAVGLCSNSYVSGLSLADCVFSGRRAGHWLAPGGGGERAHG